MLCNSFSSPLYTGRAGIMVTRMVSRESPGCPSRYDPNGDRLECSAKGHHPTFLTNRSDGPTGLMSSSGPSGLQTKMHGMIGTTAPDRV